MENRYQSKRYRKYKKIQRIFASILFALLIASIVSPTFSNFNDEDPIVTEVTEVIETTQPTESQEVTEAPVTSESVETTIQTEVVTEATQEPEVTVMSIEPDWDSDEWNNTYESEEYEDNFDWCQYIDLEDNRSGYIGRLIIPSVGINVALREGYSLTELQAYVDAHDSAAIFWNHNGRTIGDHNNQDFATLHEISVGDEVRIYDPSGNYTSYTVSDKFKGHNNGDDLTDNDWNLFVNPDPDGLTLYTCYNGWQNIWIVLLESV